MSCLTLEMKKFNHLSVVGDWIFMFWPCTETRRDFTTKSNVLGITHSHSDWVFVVHIETENVSRSFQQQSFSVHWTVNYVSNSAKDGYVKDHIASRISVSKSFSS